MLRQVVYIVTTVPLNVKLTLSVMIKRRENCPEIKNGQENKNQEAVRDIRWVLETINMATVREF
jgi:hypothetical protein